jgi:AmpE protein
MCLGCPVTKQTYKRYLQAANREDFQACSLYSEQFGNKGGDLTNVGKQLILVNYRQYASVIIFFVLGGLPGVVFYSLCKEWYLTQASQSARQELESEVANFDDKQDDVARSPLGHENIAAKAAEKVMFILDWLPSRITAFGFLVVGNFSQGLPVWLGTLVNGKVDAFDVLAKVAKASEEQEANYDAHLQEPLQMVKLAKRNIIFFLMVISIMTLFSVIG